MYWLLSAELQPFTIAAIILLALVAIEVAGTFIGASPSEYMESSALGEALDSALGWLNLGKVPFLVLLMIVLALFAASGMVLQSIARHTIGAFPAIIAAGAATAFSLIATRFVSRSVARILPRDESYATTDEDMIGRVGPVTVGPLESHAVGRMSVSDSFGNQHFPRVRPANPGEVIAAGEFVLIVARVGREFRVVRAPDRLAASKGGP